MAEISRPWGGNLLGDAGRYEGAQWSERLRALRLDSDQWNDRGPLAGAGDELIVEPTGPVSMAVQVRFGAGLVEKRLYLNTATVTLPIAGNATGVARYDRIVLRKLWIAPEAGTIRLVVLQGTPGGGVPAVTQIVGTQYEIALAYVEVVDAAAAINAADITDERELVRERRVTFGLADFVTDPGWNTAVIDELPSGDTLGWKLGANDIIEMSYDIPSEWGDSNLVVSGWIWGLSATVETADIYAASYPHNVAVANLILWGTLAQPITNVYRTPIVPTAALIVAPGEVLSLYIEETLGADDLFILGLDLIFRRV